MTAYLVRLIFVMFGKDEPNEIPRVRIKGPQSGVDYKWEFNY